MDFLDRCLVVVDNGLRTLSGTARPRRPAPEAAPAKTLDAAAGRRAAELMRVNHCGEICAQALYHGQALASRDAEQHGFLMAAAREEEDHLAWCRQRLRELDDRPSALDPVFYAASLLLGVIVAAFGDRASMAFLEATEDQVRQHLDRHLHAIGGLPSEDVKSRAIVAAMRADEERHQHNAAARENVVFPDPVKRLMGIASRLMTATTARV